MAHQHVEQVITDFLVANWTRCPIYHENVEDEPPPDRSPTISLQFPYSDTDRPYVSNRLYKEEGGFRIIIRVERGRGRGILNDWGEELRQLFEDVAISGVNCRVPSTTFTDDRSDAGALYVGYIVVPFDYQWRRD